MSDTLSQVLPWGRSFAEYCRMFDLHDAEHCSLRILDCAGGPASFNAEGTRAGWNITSADPLYQYTAAQIETRIDAAREEIVANTRLHKDRYNWDEFGSIENLVDVRLHAMRTFLADYAEAGEGQRYVNAGLPTLPFDDAAFDLALCSHYLFTYTEAVDAATHLAAIREMLRVAREVRIFPIVDHNAEPSPHLAVVRETLADEATFEHRTVPYEFQKGANQMLVLIRK